MVVAGLGGLLQLMAVAINLFFGDWLKIGNLKVTVAGMELALAGGLLGTIAVAVAGVILYAARCMMNLQKYRLVLTASIAAMIPFVSPCCLLGVPAGIWAFVVLMDAEVKAAFRDV